jgi:hypothetical protein
VCYTTVNTINIKLVKVNTVRRTVNDGHSMILRGKIRPTFIMRFLVAIHVRRRGVPKVTGQTSYKIVHKRHNDDIW